MPFKRPSKKSLENKKKRREEIKERKGNENLALQVCE